MNATTKRPVRKALPVLPTAQGPGSGASPSPTRPKRSEAAATGSRTALAKDGVLRVVVVDLSGETTVLYTPLAALCLKAAVVADPRVVGRVAVDVL